MTTACRTDATISGYPMAKKILIVDDDPVLRRTLHGALHVAGFEVAIAPDAMSAISQARAQKPDMIVLDLGLPAGGGFSVLERLQQFPPLAMVPVVVVSGQDRAANEPRAIAAGGAADIEKPGPPREIVAAAP